ncbi:DUF4401 domain-containing protein [Collimonas humicola]|uniref:DUF4401 domain-containing protein n=1 Tax=Collimonas humicola TaxID=2825886 RepID=UPI001B8B5B6E|nr:DUF4401 domain-containing protein [Collimonas humicola]
MSQPSNQIAAWDGVIAGLRESGALRQDAALPGHDDALPWSVMILQTIAAWIAAALLVAAVVVPAFIASNESAWIVCGVLLIAVATAVMRLNRQSFFLPQMAVPVAIAGAVLVAAGLKPDSWELPAFVLALILFALSGHRLLRFIAAGVMLAVLWYWMTPWLGRYNYGLREHATWMWQLAPLRNLLFSLALWWLWTHPLKLFGLGPAVWQPVRHALLWFWLGAQVWQAIGWHELFVAPSDADQWLAPNGLWLAYRLLDLLPLLLAVFMTLRRNPGLAARILPLAVLLPLCVLSPALATAALVLWIGLAEGRSYLTALGIAAALAGFGAFYYNLNWPLLYKGLLLMASGIVLLLVWLSMSRKAT